METLEVGREKLTIEPPKTQGQFLETLKEQMSGTSGARDWFKTIKAVSKFAGNETIAKRADGYLAVGAVTYLPIAAISLKNTLQKAKVWTARTVNDLAHQITDVGATTAYAASVFVVNQLPFLNAGTLIGAVSDSTDFGSVTTQYIDSKHRRAALVSASQTMRDANEHNISYSLLRMVKSVMAAIGGIFACYLLLTGVALVSPAVTMAIALISTIFSMLAFYHNNYWVNSNLKVEYLA